MAIKLYYGCGKTQLLLFLFIIFLLLHNVLTSNDFQTKCENIEEYRRKDCGFPGISHVDCFDIGCCYLDSDISGVPWCFYVNDTFYRTTTQADDVTATAMTRSSLSIQPDWIQELIKTLPKKNNEFKKSTRTSSSGDNANLNSTLFVLEIRDELSCQKTYRLYKKIHGNSRCQANYAQRISCVEGELPKQRGESECSACVNLDCCYDPIKREIEGRLISPHCYKPHDVTAAQTTIPSSSTSTSTPSPSADISASPTSSSRLQTLLSMLTASRLQNPQTTGLFGFSDLRDQGQLLQNPGLVSAKPTLSTPSSITSSTPVNKRNRLLITQHPTRGPESMTKVQGTGRTLVSEVFSLLGQNKKSGVGLTSTTVSTKPSSAPKSVNNNPASKKSNPMNFLMNYLWKKRFGTALPSVENLFVQGPEGVRKILSATKGNSIAGNLFQVTPKPATTVKTTPKFDVLSYLLNHRRPDVTKIENQESEDIFLNLVHSKVGKTPSESKSSARKEDQHNEWQHVIQPTRVPIQPRFEIGNFSSANLTTCFPNNCGHRTTDGQAVHRIVGGQWAGGIEYWPWTASLRRTFTNDDRDIHICGATVISQKWILTAAHCFMAYEKRGKKILGQKEKFIAVFSIYVGQYYRENPTPFLQIHSLESFIPHPRYDFRGLNFDIAVAKLVDHFWLNEFVQPACLPGKMDPLFAEERCWVTGWGETLYVGTQNNSKLKELSLPLVSTSDCRKSWPRHFHEAWICTEGAYQEDACAGDSGGPLVKRDNDARWHVIGVAIAGTRQCSTNARDIKPGIYTKVAYYRDFIDYETKGACNEVDWKNSS